MKAQIYLLSEAFKNSDNTKFVYVSDTTIPIRSRDDIYEVLTSDDQSYFVYYDNPHPHHYDSFHRNYDELKTIGT